MLPAGCDTYVLLVLIIIMAKHNATCYAEYVSSVSKSPEVSLKVNDAY